MNLPITYKVDISKPLLPTPLQPMLISGDAEANVIRLELYDGETPYSPGGSCVGMAVRQDGGTVPITGTVDGNTMSAVLPAAAYAIPGAMNLIIKNVNGDVKTSLFFGCGNVLIGETGTAIDPGTIIPSVTDLIQRIDEAVDSIPADYTALLASIAPDYANLSFPVSAGTYAWYNGTLYSAAADIPASETWTPSHWKAAVMGDELTDLKSALSLKQHYGKSLWEKGHLLGSSGANAPNNYNRIRTKTFLPDNFVAISVADGYKCWIYCYNEAGVFQGVWTGSTVVKTFSMDYAVQGFAALKTISNSYRYRLVVGDNTAQVELSPENDGDKILFTTFTDATLTKSGVSADAGAVGTALLPNLQCVAITAADATSVYSNLATNLPHNTYSWIAASFFNDMPSDVASTEYGWVFTLSSTLTRGSNGTVKTQMLIFPAPLSTTDEKFKFYFRRIQSGSMSGWVKWPETDTSVLRNELLLPSGDLNDMAGNQCGLLISTNTYTHAPFALGTIFNLDFSDTLSVQFGYQFGTGALFYRRKSTTWGDWVRLTPPNMDAYRTTGKYVAFGDSLAWGAVWSPTSGVAYHQVKAEWRIPTRIALATGMQNNFVNAAIGGIGYFNEQDGQTLISQISGYDFSDVELVTVMAGANDHFWTDLGTASDAESATTICGAIKNIIHTISAKNPKTQIIIIQPPPCGIDGTQYDVWSSKQGDGYVFRWSLAEFDEQVSQLCHNEHVGYLNWWDSTMCRNWQYAGYNGSTGPNFTHPTADYDYCLLGNFIAGKVSSLYHGLN